MDFSPFNLCEPGSLPPKPRRIVSLEGLGDRMRTAAFAEWQAIHAFGWAAERFDDVPQPLRDAWTAQIADERKHYALICKRMSELGLTLKERPVSPRLWESLEPCTSGKEFCLKIANAEERGRQAALKLVELLASRDPDTAAGYSATAADEVAQVALAKTYFG